MYLLMFAFAVVPCLLKYETLLTFLKFGKEKLQNVRE